jgi:hypothetical protein
MRRLARIRSSIRQASLPKGGRMKAWLAVLAALSAAVTLTSVAAAGPTSTALDAEIVAQWNAIAQVETIRLRPTAHGESRGIAMSRARSTMRSTRSTTATSRICSTRSSIPTARRAQPPRPRPIECSWRSRPPPDTRASTPLTRRRWRRSPTAPANRKVSMQAKLPPRRCSPLDRATASWRRSTSVS